MSKAVRPRLGDHSGNAVASNFARASQDYWRLDSMETRVYQVACSWASRTMAVSSFWEPLQNRGFPCGVPSKTTPKRVPSIKIPLSRMPEGVYRPCRRPQSALGRDIGAKSAGYWLNRSPEFLKQNVGKSDRLVRLVSFGPGIGLPFVQA